MFAYSGQRWPIVGLLLAWLLILPCGAAGAESTVADGGFERFAASPRQSAWVIPSGAGGVRSGAGRVKENELQGYAAWLNPLTDYGAELVQPLMALVPGRLYTLTAWVRAAEPGAVACIGIRTQNDFPRLYRGLTGAGWERMELEFTAPQGWAQIVLSNTAGVTVWWDDIELTESRTVAERLAVEWDKRLAQGKPIYTGLVVNALGTGLERGMSPKIYDAKGQLVFAGIGASFDQLVRKGLVAYVNTLEEATSHPRLAVSSEYPLRLPLIADAQGVNGMPRTGVIIGEEDARRLRLATEEYDFLGRFAIVFVVD